MKKQLLVVLFLGILSFGVFAQTKFASPFSDNMVLQRNDNVKIWGTDNPNTPITVATSWNNQTYNTTSDSNGKWNVIVSTPDGSENAYTLTVSGTTTATLSNVLIGEVWMCSGQSNMEMAAGWISTDFANTFAAATTDDKIRGIRNNRLRSLDEEESFMNTWRVITGENSKWISLVAIYFAKKLRQELGVPIGFIDNSYGGSHIEAWLDTETAKQFDYVTIPTELTAPEYRLPTVIYNAAVNPWVGFGMKGVLWYQGESNKARPDQYAEMFPAMINSWRTKWGIGDFPFYYVQIVPFTVSPQAYLPFWNLQRKAYYEIPNSGVVVTLDKPYCESIHPPEKQYIGDRLALWALSQDYGFDSIVPSGPLCTSAQRINSTLKVYFDFAETGLVAGSNGLSGFEIAGENNVYYPAQAIISYDNTLILSSPSVTEPKYARYGNGTCANISASLFNGVSLPASAFICEDTLNTGITEVSISPMSAYIELSESLQLQVNTSSPSVTWESTNTSVATVDENGIVTAVGYGTANITVTTTDGNYRAASFVTVPIHVTGISVEPINVSLAPADMAQLKAIYAPSDATIKSVIWESDNASVATVDIYGKITAVANGFATIKAIADDGSFEATCAVEVTATPNVALNKPILFSTHQVPNDNLVDGNANDSSRWEANEFPQWAEIDLGTDYDISKFELFPYQDRDYQYTIEVKAEGGSTYFSAIDRGSNTTGENVITDTVTITGRYVRITVVGANSYNGTLVEINEFKVSGVLPTVYATGVSMDPANAILNPAKSTQLTAIVAPNDANEKSVQWSSDDTSIATVDANGEVTGVADGLVNITATTIDGNFIAICEVLVSSESNVALRKPVSVSRVTDPAANLTDGNTGSRWSANPFPQWAEVDLGADYNIIGFEVFPYKNRDYKYTIELKTDAESEYTTVVSRGNYISEADILADIVSATGRYVKITVTGANTYSGSFVSLNELKVYGKLANASANHESKLNTLKISPNPSSGILNIDFNTNYEVPFVNIVDLSGRILINQQLIAPGNSISLSSLKQGIYMLYLKDGDKMVHCQKIILCN